LQQYAHGTSADTVQPPLLLLLPLWLLQLLSLFLVPETAKVPLESITELWLQHRVWSKLVKPKQQPARRTPAASSGSRLGTAFKAAAAAVRHPGVGLFERQHGSLEHALSGGPFVHSVDNLAAELQQHSHHRL
jgi:hypothetical protein